MSVAAFLILVIVIIAAIVAVPAFLASAQNYRNSLNANQKSELRELRAFKQDVRQIAARQADVNPEMATQIQGLLYDMETKELG